MFSISFIFDIIFSSIYSIEGRYNNNKEEYYISRIYLIYIPHLEFNIL